METISRSKLVSTAKKVRAKKRLGQNFFVEPQQLSDIVKALSLVSSDHVLEIGPGLGFLTQFLLAGEEKPHITAIELDSNLVELLEERLASEIGSHLTVMNADFLEIEIGSIKPKINKIAGNIPYQITSPIFQRIFGEIGNPSPWHGEIERVVLTIQLEVARRLVAQPGSKDYSHLTILKEYLFDAELLFEVPPTSFIPEPDVRSAVVLLTPKREVPIKCSNVKLLRRVVASGFKQRRKMLKNTLQFPGVSEAQLTDILREARINPLSRAEDLSLAQFGLLTEALLQLDVVKS